MSNQEIEHGAVSKLKLPKNISTKQRKWQKKARLKYRISKPHQTEKKIFTPKQWLERFRQYAKRKHKMDITELIRGAEMTQTGWSGKETEIQEDFIWGIGPEALYQMTRAEYKTEPDKIAVKDLIRLFNEYFLPERNTYHNRENSSGQDKPNPKHQKTFGGDL